MLANSAEREKNKDMARDTKTDEVVNELQRRIREGIYAPGQRLPSERDLADEMNVSRPTIRTVLLRLQAENTIDIVPRGGVFVRSPRQKLAIGPSAPLRIRKKNPDEHTYALENQEISIHYTFPSGIVITTPDMAETMGFVEKTQVLRRHHVHFINGIPYRIVDSYYSIVLLDKIPEYYDDPIPWLRQYAEQSPFPPEAFESVKCRMPDEMEADLLNIGRNQPVLDIERWVLVRDIQPHMSLKNYSITLHDPDLFREEDAVFAYVHTTANAALHEFTYRYDKANWQSFLEKMQTGA